jgi:hypothetical protein
VGEALTPRVPLTSERRSQPVTITISITPKFLFMWSHECGRGRVYVWCTSRVRTTIELKEAYFRTIMDRYGPRTKLDVDRHKIPGVDFRMGQV